MIFRAHLLHVFLTIGVLFTGCAGRPTIERVRYRMWPAEVVAELGQPDRVEKDSEDPRIETWIYALEGAKCAVTFKSNVVINRPPCQTEDRRLELIALEEFRDPGILERKKAQEKLARLRAPSDVERVRDTRRDPR